MITFNNTCYYPIPTHPDYYISQTGDIFSAKRHKILKPWLNSNGRYTIRLGRGKNLFIHRLVALTFLGEPNGLVVRHLDGNPLNNSITNLAYGTQADNEQDSIKHGTHYRNTKITPDIARRIAIDPRPYKLISKSFNLSYGQISDIKCGLQWARVTNGIRFQRGRHNSPTNKRLFTPTEISVIIDHKNTLKSLAQRFNCSIDTIKRVRRENPIPNI